MSSGIDVESCVTVDDACPITCEVLADEIQFRFGSNAAGLNLYFDWPGLVKFLGLVATMAERAHARPPGKLPWFTISADESSSDDHAPA